jgi:hypothetical protein
MIQKQHHKSFSGVIEYVLVASGLKYQESLLISFLLVTRRIKFVDYKFTISISRSADYQPKYSYIPTSHVAFAKSKSVRADGY